jgi:hypothetical protein
MWILPSEEAVDIIVVDVRLSGVEGDWGMAIRSVEIALILAKK